MYERYNRFVTRIEYFAARYAYNPVTPEMGPAVTRAFDIAVPPDVAAEQLCGTGLRDDVLQVARVVLADPKHCQAANRLIKHMEGDKWQI